jgi:chromosome segregation ATPase
MEAMARQSWTDDRLDERFDHLEGQMNHRFSHLEREVDQRFGRVEGEIKDLRGEIRDVRGEMKDLRGEMKAGDDALRGEMKAGNDALRGEIGELRTEFAALNRTLIQASLGIAGAIVAAALINLV